MFRMPPLAVLMIVLASWIPASAQDSAPDPQAVSVKISLSAGNPDLSSGTHEGKDPISFWLFSDGERTRGGEFGLVLSGGTCLGFVVDPEVGWVSLPMNKPYPGTIAQVTIGDECRETPLCFGTLTVLPDVAGGRITVDVIPSERAQDVTMIACDYHSINVVRACPAVVNGGNAPPPAPHLVARPPDPGPRPAPPTPAGDAGESGP